MYFLTNRSFHGTSHLKLRRACCKSRVRPTPVISGKLFEFLTLAYSLAQRFNHTSFLEPLERSRVDDFVFIGGIASFVRKR